MRKRLVLIIALSFALMAVIATVGCANTGIIENAAGVQRLEDEPQKTVVIWHTYSDEETRLFEQEVIPEFEREYPGIHIESVRQSSNEEYQAALIARASAGKPPDVIRLDYSWVPRFADRGLLYPLNRFSDFEDVAMQLRDHMLETNRYGGSFYGLPLNINTKAAIYNRTLLEEAGFDAPPSSMREVVDAARKHRYIIGMAELNLWSSLPYFFGLGGRLADEHFTRTEGYFNSDESVQAIETLVSLYRDGVINPHLLTGNGDLWTGVHSGRKLFMIDEGPWYYSILLNTKILKVDLLKATQAAPFPSGGVYGSIIGGESLVLTKGSRYKEEAWTFIRWMMRKETQSVMFKAGLIPTNMEAFQEYEIGRTDNVYIDAFMKGVEDAFYRPPLPQWNEIERIYEGAMEDIFVGGRNIRETLDEASSKIDALLANK
ncbi:extracellular solute-binding protein [Paenibacillus alkalitolerans]|uniref:extracellular solute-binding protein n=1 Tax=Paenibacillus alkalitolerans TaxID=2799335 RepID=UPI0018F699CC|nr:extracellular solute-binding protein [Paenibacillus alkalitolerans]